METRKESGVGVKPVHGILESPAFRRLVVKRWRVSVVFTVLLFIIYYGYILLIGYDKELLSTKIGKATTLGIPLGVGVIALSWLLTVAYVVWANRSYDPEVKKLKDQIR